MAVHPNMFTLFASNSLCERFFGTDTVTDFYTARSESASNEWVKGTLCSIMARRGTLVAIPTVGGDVWPGKLS